MTVYVLFHADLEDDRYVRGVYERREDAEADLTGGSEEHGYIRDHDDACCSVDEMPLLTAPVGTWGPEYGPFPPLSPFMQAFMEDMVARMLAPSPYRFVAGRSV